MTLHLPDALANGIRRQGEAAYPGECCGVLAGAANDAAKSVVRIVPVSNRRTDDPHRYLIAADDLRRVEGELRRDGLEIVGYYHSHPDHPAVPSAFDTEHAWPWYSYVIVRVAGGRGAELASWVLDDDHPVMRPESLEVQRGLTMPVTVSIPTPLRNFTGGRDTLHLRGATVGEVLDGLLAMHSGLRRHLMQEDGRLRSFVNLYLNDTDIRALKSVQTPVHEGDVLTIVPSIAGGSPAADAAAVDAKPELPKLSHAEVLRYSRHLLLPEVGLEGQRKLKAARVLTIGAGGLGSPLSLYLAAAGVGTIGIVDFDVVDLTNLQRQIVHGTSTLGQPKLASAKARLTDLNPSISVEGHETRLSSENALDLIRQYDIVVDGTDNFQTRYLVNDACVLLGKPNVYGSIFRFEGQASLFYANEGPCYRCLYPEPPPPGLVPSCAEGGVLGVLPGIIGSIQALETIKWIIGAGDSLVGRLVLFDALKLRFRELKLRKDPNCPICGTNPTIRELIDYEVFCGIGDGPSYSGNEIAAEDLAAELKAKRDLILIDVREPHEWEIAHIEGARLIPLSQLPDRLNELDGHAEIVTQCHKGVRSMRALEILRGAGFTKVRSLAGGINAWAERVEPGMARY